MHRRYGLLVVLTVVVVVATAYAGWTQFQPFPQLPFTVRFADAQHARIEPIPGLTPATLHAGDRLDLAAQSRATRFAPATLNAGDRLDLAAQSHATRIALVTSEVTNLPSTASYPLLIQRGTAQVSVSVRAVNGNTGALASLVDWLELLSVILFAGIALLALWRGHDRAAWGLAFWMMAQNPLAFASAGLTPGGNGLALLGLLGYWGFSLLAPIGFYVMAESIAGGTLGPRQRALWRSLFALVLGAATITSLGGPIAVVAAGWAGLMRPLLALLPAASYLVPIALLFASHRHADARQRLRLRWLLWGSVVFMAGLVFNDVPLPLSFWVTLLLTIGLTTLGALAMLYAVLRHRVVDVTVVLNRGLVYAATTSLVLGLFALLESLIERSALGHGASLALEFAVPLGLGAALSTVHRRIDALVERFLFRRQYRMETALRRFAQECAFITQPGNLFDLTVEQIARHAGAPRVALYERTPEAYIRIRQHGEPALPEQVPMDDLAFVGLRARNAELDLDDTRSQLGRDGYAFPLMVRGSLLGALVVGQRPGEHYAADERELLFHVAHEVGAALFALRARESQALVRALAQGNLKPEDARAQAIQLETTWLMA
ncbi:GAF domain-containing protein [Metallibacterium sp.]|uniref:GAF domain-containing protein n=1 Tax=Metallibacterium sp. TaxID=2940281 RepID=UPI0026326626|nr:GAF domain-containing protein [Metallibacterium sp.]